MFAEQLFSSKDHPSYTRLSLHCHKVAYTTRIALSTAWSIAAASRSDTYQNLVTLRILLSGRHIGHTVNPFTPRSNCNSPYYQPYNSYNVSSENLVLDQQFIPKLIFFFIFISYLVDIVPILWGEILSWSLMGVKGLVHRTQGWEV